LIKQLSSALSTVEIVKNQSTEFSFTTLFINVVKLNKMKKIHVLIAFALICFCGRLQAQDGALDLTFNQQIGSVTSVKSIITQTDGKTVVGGIFSKGVARLNSDGFVDPTFNIGTGADSTVSVVYIQSDGKLLVGGNFTSFNGIAANMIVRLNNDGSIDPTFLSGTGFQSSTSSRWNPGSVNTIVQQTDGKLFIGGSFDDYNGLPINNLVRLNSNGVPDLTFDPGTGPDASVYSMAIQTDGKLLIGGRFFSYNSDVGFTHAFLARIHTNGSLDTIFINNTSIGPINVSFVSTISLQSDGKIIVGGNFDNFNVSNAKRIVRLNSDGTLDPAFMLNAIDPIIYLEVRATAIQPDGKILVGGIAPSWSSDTINRIVRLNSNGSVDATFNSGTGVNLGDVVAIALQQDGKILIGGDFEAYNGTTRDGLARLQSAPLGVESTLEETAAISVFPNPSNGIFHLQLNEELANASITVFDELGNKMPYVTVELDNSQLKIDLTNCEKGVYYVMITRKNNMNNADKTQLTGVKLYFTHM